MYRYVVETKAHSPVCSLERQPRLSKSCRIQLKKPTYLGGNEFIPSGCAIIKEHYLKV